MRPAAVPGAKEEEEKGVEGGDRRKEVEKVCPPQEASLGPSQILLRGPRPGPACALCPSHMVCISKRNRQLLAGGSSY